MPALSPTMSHGNLAAWTVKEGDEVSAGDALAEIETDKATLTWETQDDGIVGKILVPEGSKDVEVGTIVALLVDDAADVPKLASYTPPPTGVPAALSASMGNAMEVAAPMDASVSGDDTWHDRLGPAVRVLLETFHLDADNVHHTGPHGILTKGDVLAAAQDGTARPAPPRPAKASPPPAASTPAPTAPAPPTATAPFVDIPVSQIRRIIASRLCESKQTIPHLYLTADVKVDGVATVRSVLKKMGLKVRAYGGSLIMLCAPLHALFSGESRIKLWWWCTKIGPNKKQKPLQSHRRYRSMISLYKLLHVRCTMSPLPTPTGTMPPRRSVHFQMSTCALPSPPPPGS